MDLRGKFRGRKVSRLRRETFFFWKKSVILLFYTIIILFYHQLFLRNGLMHALFRWIQTRLSMYFGRKLEVASSHKWSNYNDIRDNMFSETNFGVFQRRKWGKRRNLSLKTCYLWYRYIFSRMLLCTSTNSTSSPLTFFQNTFKVVFESNEKVYVLERGKSTQKKSFHKFWYQKWKQRYQITTEECFFSKTIHR